MSDTNGALFDLLAIGWGLGLGGAVLLICALRAKHRGRRKPFDWMTDAPEYGHSKDGHVKVVP